ncbi:hypothetical protein ON010_g2822 [Phytophthora cinnamomi]|nr:hypothetical protein ON010_g2822 [Phytophthora cinnamomi]
MEDEDSPELEAPAMLLAVTALSVNRTGDEKFTDATPVVTSDSSSGMLRLESLQSDLTPWLTSSATATSSRTISEKSCFTRIATALKLLVGRRKEECDLDPIDKFRMPTSPTDGPMHSIRET